METNQTTNQTTETSRPCKRCEGKGTIFHAAWSYEGKTYPERSEVCPYCHGVGTYDKPDAVVILRSLIATKGKNKGRIKTSAPKYSYHNVDECRTYYVWRLFRFHSGLDVTLPMNAEMVNNYDPYRRDLDAVAEWLAYRATGKRSAGAVRWSVAFGTLTEAEGAALNDCETALPNGPVHDGHKPTFEHLELK